MEAARAVFRDIGATYPYKAIDKIGIGGGEVEPDEGGVDPSFVS